MITAIVTFRLPPSMTREQWLSTITPVAARFQGVPGLIRKQFIYREDATGPFGGGVYLWESRAAADALYQSGWRDSIRRVAVDDPQIAWFDTQIVVDNDANAIKTAA